MSVQHDVDDIDGGEASTSSLKSSGLICSSSDWRHIESSMLSHSSVVEGADRPRSGVSQALLDDRK